MHESKDGNELDLYLGPGRAYWHNGSSVAQTSVCEFLALLCKDETPQT